MGNGNLFSAIAPLGLCSLADRGWTPGFCDLPVSLPENHFKISLLSAEMKHTDPQFHCTLCCVFHYVRLISKIIQGLHNYIQSGHSFQ